MTPSEIVEELRIRFAAAGDPEVAAPMKAYMKDQFEVYGIKSPDRRALYKDLMPIARKLEAPLLENLVVLLWDEEMREFQYFGIDLLQKLGKKIPNNFLPILMHLISTRSWWDTVDSIASNPLGILCRRQPEVLAEMDQWIDHDNIWIRRSAILCQLKAKGETDVDRLFAYCKARMHEKEFFIRKAIGWALRAYAYVDPELVRKFVEEHKEQMSGLSVREAMKNIS